MLQRFRSSKTQDGPVLKFRGDKGIDLPMEENRQDPQIDVPAPKEPEAPEFADFERSADYVELKVELHQELLTMINLGALEKLTEAEVHAQIGEMVSELLAQKETPLNTTERNQLVKDIVDEILGLGPIEPLLKDPSVADIIINTHEQVYVERSGNLELTKVKFKDSPHLLRIIDKIVTGVGRRIDESQPTVDARLPDGSRVNAVIPPVAVDGPLVSIRKFSANPLTIDRLISYNALTEDIAQILEGIVRCRLNVLIAGGTGTGKTTMLNALSSFIGEKERVVTIEDAAELNLQQAHVARMETRPANMEGRGEIDQRELVRNALRMRPDRIIVGECRGGEAFDMLQAMNTGHDGSMTTIHANTPRDAMSRLEQMIGMTGMDLPMRSMRAQIASAIDVIVQIKRFSDGKRRLISLTEITGMEGDIITMQEVFNFNQTHVDEDGQTIGDFHSTGIRPNFMDLFEARGIEMPESVLGNRGII